MSYEYDNETAARRVDAYTRFLMDAYETDLDGLADVTGATVDEIREFNAADYLEKSANTMYQLARVTGISVSWLFAESEVSQ